jgi:hypothetical protein
MLLGVEELRGEEVRVRFSSFTWTLSTFARPREVGDPSASLSVASKSLKVPRKVPTTCLTANPTLE